jgi:hypothetical protein
MEECLERSKRLLRIGIRRTVELLQKILRSSDKVVMLIGVAFDSKSGIHGGSSECGEVHVRCNVFLARLVERASVASMRPITGKSSLGAIRGEKFLA